MVGHRGDLDDVGVEVGEAPLQAPEVAGGALEVVVTDDPLGLAVAADLPGDVVLEIDVFDPLDDRRPEHELPRLLAAGPMPAVDGAPAGGDHRAGPVAQEPFDLHVALDEVEAQLDQTDPVLRQELVLGDDVPVPAAGDPHADHVSCFPTGGFQGRGTVGDGERVRSGGTGGRVRAARA